MTPPQTTVLYGYCHCGCGQETPIYQKNHTARKNVKGASARYISGHHLARATLNSARASSVTKRPPERTVVHGGDAIRIHLTRGFSAIVDLADGHLAAFNWRALVSDGIVYAVRTRTDKKTVTLHTEICRVDVGMQVDHINGDSLDNRRCNLRAATPAQNSQNRKGKTGTTHLKGIFFSKRTQRWGAKIKCRGKNFFLGGYATEIEAALAYDEAARKLHGNFARLNFDDRNPVKQLRTMP